MFIKNKAVCRFVIFYIFFISFSMFGLVKKADAVFFSREGNTVNRNTKEVIGRYFSNLIVTINKESYSPGEMVVVSLLDSYRTRSWSKSGDAPAYNRPIDIRNGELQFRHRTTDNWAIFNIMGMPEYVKIGAYLTSNEVTFNPGDRLPSSVNSKARYTDTLDYSNLPQKYYAGYPDWPEATPQSVSVGPITVDPTKRCPQTQYVVITTPDVEYAGGPMLNRYFGKIPFVVSCSDSDLSATSSACNGPDGVVIQNGSSKNYYSRNNGTSRQCLDSVVTRTCTNGVLSGTARYSSCPTCSSCPVCSTTPSPENSVTSFRSSNVSRDSSPTSCVGPDGSIITNGSGKYYYTMSCGTALNCYFSAQIRRCNNSVLSGSATNSTCRPCSN